MQQLTKFSTFIFESTHHIRVVINEDKYWFVASDICKLLEYQKSTSAVIEQHCRSEGCTKMVLPSIGGKQNTILIDEGNLYRLVFKSQKPEAKRFESWVCDEVLPQIRKTGAYQADNQRINSWREMLAELDERYVLAQEMDEFAIPLVQHLQSLIERVSQLEQNQPTEASDYVYVLHNRQTQEYKIGKSGDIPTRQKALQIVEPNIYLFLKIAMQSARHASLWERTLQLEFESKRLHGEWFKLNEQDLVVLRFLARVVAFSAENI